MPGQVEKEVERRPVLISSRSQDPEHRVSGRNRSVGLSWGQLVPQVSPLKEVGHSSKLLLVLAEQWWKLFSDEKVDSDELGVKCRLSYLEFHRSLRCNLLSIDSDLRSTHHNCNWYSRKDPLEFQMNLLNPCVCKVPTTLTWDVAICSRITWMTFTEAIAALSIITVNIVARVRPID